MYTNIKETTKSASLSEHQAALIVLISEFDRVCKKLDIPYILFAGTMLGAVRHKGFIPWDDDLDVLMLREDYERLLSEAEDVIDSERFYLQKEFSEHWPMFFSKLRLNGTTCLETYHPRDPEAHCGVYIDIFPCDSASRYKLGRKIQFYASKVVIAKSLKRRGYETESKLKKLFMNFCSVLPTSPFLRMTKHGSKDSKYVHSFLGGAASFEKNIYLREYITERTEAEFEEMMLPVPVNYDPLLRAIYGDYSRIPPEEERKIKKHAVLVDLDRPYEYYRDEHQKMKFDVHTRSIR